jgi:hypothetical protein
MIFKLKLQTCKRNREGIGQARVELDRVIKDLEIKKEEARKILDGLQKLNCVGLE